MRKLIKGRRQSAALIVSFVALFVSLSGVGYAVSMIGSDDIKKHAVKKRHLAKNVKQFIKKHAGEPGAAGQDGQDGQNGQNGNDGQDGAPGPAGKNGDGSKIGPVGFERSAFVPGDVDGQGGWSKTGPYDVEVEEVAGFPDAAGYGFGDQALRMSNAVTSGAFGDQAFSRGLADEAGEPDSDNGGFGSGDAQPFFEATFNVGTTDADEQVGSRFTVSPDRGDGSRISFLSFDDMADGVHVTFFDVTNPGPSGTVSSFDPTEVATLSRDEAHSVRFLIEFVPGPGNDVVEIYIDGALVHTGTTWEDYYRFDPEQVGNSNLVPTADKLLFRLSGTAVPGTAGGGFLVDGMKLVSSPEKP